MKEKQMIDEFQIHIKQWQLNERYELYVRQMTDECELTLKGCKLMEEFEFSTRECCIKARVSS